MCEKDSCIRFPRHIVMEILIYLYLYSVGVVRVDSKLPSASADSSFGLFDYEDSMDTGKLSIFCLLLTNFSRISSHCYPLLLGVAGV